jgi:hypothetical protein
MTIISKSMSEEALKTLEVAMENAVPFTHPLVEGFKARGAAPIVIKYIEAFGFDLTDEQRALVDACRDPKQMKVWADRVTIVRTAEEIFAPVDEAVA